MATLAARAYGALADYATRRAPGRSQPPAQPDAPQGYECLAAAAYAAKQTRKGDLALAKALSLVPKLSAAPTLKHADPGRQDDAQRRAVLLSGADRRPRQARRAKIVAAPGR